MSRSLGRDAHLSFEQENDGSCVQASEVLQKRYIHLAGHMLSTVSAVTTVRA